MSKSFRYVKEFEFGGCASSKYAKGGKVKGERVEKIAVKRKDTPKEMLREKSAMRMEKREMNIPGNRMAFNNEPLIQPAMKKGGSAKIGKVMGEFKSGELHSGSKKGPTVTSRKQAVAIAMSEARKKK